MGTTADDAFEYDANNDRFRYVLRCPYPGCDVAVELAPQQSPELRFCESCLRPYEIVRLQPGDDLGGANPWTARRPDTRFCARSGQRLDGPSPTDWAGWGRQRATRQLR